TVFDPQASPEVARTRHRRLPLQTYKPNSGRRNRDPCAALLEGLPAQGRVLAVVQQFLKGQVVPGLRHYAGQDMGTVAVRQLQANRHRMRRGVLEAQVTVVLHAGFSRHWLLIFLDDERRSGIPSLLGGDRLSARQKHRHRRDPGSQGHDNNAQRNQPFRVHPAAPYRSSSFNQGSAFLPSPRRTCTRRSAAPPGKSSSALSPSGQRTWIESTWSVWPRPKWTRGSLLQR